jgi:predicted DCC family thiol-disulfide oxidoreductase YuxK
MAPLLSRIGLGVKPLQDLVSHHATPDARPGAELTPDELLADIRLLFADGRQLAGADVYRYVLRHVWWGVPLYWLAITPGLRWVFDHAYRMVADRRHRISRACRIAPVNPLSGALPPSVPQPKADLAHRPR